METITSNRPEGRDTTWLINQIRRYLEEFGPFQGLLKAVLDLDIVFAEDGIPLSELQEILGLSEYQMDILVAAIKFNEMKNHKSTLNRSYNQAKRDIEGIKRVFGSSLDINTLAIILRKLCDIFGDILGILVFVDLLGITLSDHGIPLRDLLKAAGLNPDLAELFSSYIEILNGYSNSHNRVEGVEENIEAEITKNHSIVNIDANGIWNSDVREDKLTNPFTFVLKDRNRGCAYVLLISRIPDEIKRRFSYYPARRIYRFRIEYRNGKFIDINSGVDLTPLSIIKVFKI